MKGYLVITPGIPAVSLPVTTTPSTNFPGRVLAVKDDGRVVSVQPDGTIQDRDPGTDGGYEAAVATLSGDLVYGPGVPPHLLLPFRAVQE